MSRRNNKKKESGSSGSPAWMATFSDLMTLLLTFFILLYSMSSIDVVKFKNISDSLQAVLSGLGEASVTENQSDSESTSVAEEVSENVDPVTVDEEILEMYEKVMEHVEEEKLDAIVTVNLNKRGVFVEIKDAILFESGSSEIKESGLIVLNQLEGLINEFENNIVIEGHTDNVPIRRVPFPSNWELSTSRAVSVVRYLSEVEKVDPTRLSAIGYGEYKPIAANDTSENREINRRVNILIIIDEESDELNGN